jgi:hypothetical protein
LRSWGRHDIRFDLKSFHAITETGNNTTFMAKRPLLLFSLMRDTTLNASADDVSEGAQDATFPRHKP